MSAFGRPMTGRRPRMIRGSRAPHDRQKMNALPAYLPHPAAVHVVRVDPQRLVHAPHPHLPPLRRRLRSARGKTRLPSRISAGLPPTLGFGACQSSSWARRRVVARGGGPSMADAGAFGTGAGEADYAESTDKLENFFNSFEDEDIHGQVGRSVRLGSGSEPGQGRGSGLGIGSRWCVRSWPRHTQCTR